jgi:DNA topoisomerase-3
VFELPMAYVCERAVGASKTCDFRSGRVILQQTIQPEQMRKLLAEGRTDLLRDFVSNRTRRKFAARLVRKPDGTTGFEFEPRPPRAAKGTAKEAGTAEANETVAKSAVAAPARPSRTARTAADAPKSPGRSKATAPKVTAKKAIRRKTAAKPDKKKPARRAI